MSPIHSAIELKLWETFLFPTAQYQYLRYCVAKDNAQDSRGLAIPNWMSMAYVRTVRGPGTCIFQPTGCLAETECLSSHALVHLQTQIAHFRQLDRPLLLPVVSHPMSGW